MVKVSGITPYVDVFLERSALRDDSNCWIRLNVVAEQRISEPAVVDPIPSQQQDMPVTGFARSGLWLQPLCLSGTNM